MELSIFNKVVFRKRCCDLVLYINLFIVYIILFVLLIFRKKWLILFLMLIFNAKIVLSSHMEIIIHD